MRINKITAFDIAILFVFASGILIAILTFNYPILYNWFDTKYWQSFNNWASLFLSIINILVLYGLNLRVEKANKVLKDSQIYAERQLMLARLKNERLLQFKEEWDSAFLNFVENPSNESNHRAFDNFKDVYTKFLNVEELFDCHIIDAEIVKWWNQKFEEVDRFFITKTYYKIEENSSKWLEKKNEFYKFMIDGISN